MTEEEKKALADKLAKEAQEKNEKSPEQLKQELENYKRAMLEERTKRQEEAEARKQKDLELEDLKKFKQELEEKEKLKKGEYETVIAELKAKIGEYEPLVNQYNEFLTKSKQETEAKVTEYLSKIPEAELDFVKMAINGKDWNSQIKLLEWFITKFKIPTFKDDKVPEKSKEEINWQWDKKAELYAKIKWWTASPSEKSEYIALLRAK